jgi:hypothetical protein
MTDSSTVKRTPHRARRPRARVAVAAVIAASSVALLAAACTSPSTPSAGSSSSPSSGGSANSQLVAYSHCMRSDGLPNYPDPTVIGGVTTLPKESAQHLGVSSARFSAAESACQHLLPQTSSLTASSLQQCYLAEVCPAALVQHAVTAGRQFASCMRSHGVPAWPDPTIDSEGRPVFNINVPRPTPHKTSAAINECTRLDHAGSLLAWG